jgi:hypothetical protein
VGQIVIFWSGIVKSRSILLLVTNERQEQEIHFSPLPMSPRPARLLIISFRNTFGKTLVSSGAFGLRAHSGSSRYSSEVDTLESGAAKMVTALYQTGKGSGKVCNRSRRECKQKWSRGFALPV